MKPIWIAATALFALSPMAMAQEAHNTHDHGDKAAIEATTGDSKTCMAGQAGCLAKMELRKTDGHMQDHGANGHELHGASGVHPMPAKACKAMHDAKGGDPVEHCPMMAADEAAATE